MERVAASYEEAAEDRNMLERESSIEISLDLLREDRVENFFQ